MGSTPKLSLVAGAVALILVASACERNEAVLVESDGTSQAAPADDSGTSQTTPADDSGTSQTTQAEDGGSSQPAPAEEESSPAQFAVGDRVRLGNWEFVVYGVTDPYDNGNGFGEPDEGQRWVAVDVEIFNMGNEPRDPFPLLCFDVQDSLNRSYEQAIFAETEVGRPDGEIAAGQSRRGTVVWKVLEEADDLRMNVKCDIFSSGSATYKLS
jgi:hypothetical protein